MTPKNDLRTDGPILVDEGAALASHLGRLDVGATSAERGTPATDAGCPYDVVVVGAGKSGLSVGYHLKQRGLRFLILDAHERVGDPWRARWDSLRLFTPARFSSLVGYPFPADGDSFPTKDAMADYLEAYAARFELPVRTGARVRRLAREGSGFLLSTDRGSVRADQVVIAMANYQRPHVPAFAKELGSDVVQLHSSAYRNPAQLRDGPVLVVGAGNSGAEIARELSAWHPTFLSGHSPGEMPFRIDGFLGRLFLVRLVIRVLFHRVLTVRNPLGRMARTRTLHGSGPLIRTKGRDLWRAGVRPVPRTVAVQEGMPVLKDGRRLEVANVVWCTGYRPGFEWIDLPIFDDHGEPRDEDEELVEVPGLHFVGLHFARALSSAMIHAAERDAALAVDAVEAQRSRHGARGRARGSHTTHRAQARARALW